MLDRIRLVVTRNLFYRSIAFLPNDCSPCRLNLQIFARDPSFAKFYSTYLPRAVLTKKYDTLPVNKFTNRTHTCGELNTSNEGEQVQLCGWMEFQRMGKFVILRDAYGSTQLIIPDEKKELMKIVDKLAYESILRVVGKVIPRPDNQENPNMETGCIEVEVESLEIINESISQLPFSIRKYNTAKESLQLKYRYLSLRFPELQRNLRLRSKVTKKMRDYLIDHCAFVEVETPTLFRGTPGGAQEFVVPTQHPGQFYSLVQSPQQFKQLLMIGGIDRYFQIARCYRDEGARNDRQPEFTQLDIEMSFVQREDVMDLVEGLVECCWSADEFGPIELPIPRMTFEQVYEMYGSEQPDLRIPYRIYNITEFLNSEMRGEPHSQAYALSYANAQDFLTKSVNEKLIDMRNKNFSDTNLSCIKIAGDTWKKKLCKFYEPEALKQILNLNNGDALFVVRGKKHQARCLLGKIRVEFANIMESSNRTIRSRNHQFLWVNDFPLFEKDETNNWFSTHHPFTQPHPDDFQYLETDPSKVRGLHYDLVLNGSEIAGGSIRIHNACLQERIFEMLHIDRSQMKHLLNALASGAPPHGGIAFGLDRLMSIICEAPSIRSVIAFPKTMEGRDLMSGAPTAISDEEKRLYHLKTTDIFKHEKL